MEEDEVKAPFIAVGDLWLYCQEGGFADDAFVLKERDASVFLEQIANAFTNLHIGAVSLDNVIAEYFGVKRQMPSGNRHIGLVKITIERLSDANKTD